MDRDLIDREEREEREEHDDRWSELEVAKREKRYRPRRDIFAEYEDEEFRQMFR